VKKAIRHTAPRGTNDVLPPESERLQWIEENFRRACQIYGYREIRTPTFESAELFRRSTGETTDIVSKEMYVFTDRGGRQMALKPEGTPGVVRALLESGALAAGGQSKLYYLGPIFRYERPQAGRYREAHQAGVEAFGSAQPLLDVEVIDLCLAFLQQLRLSGLSLQINSLGCGECRPNHRGALIQHFADKQERLCEDCRRRLQQNPLRIFDCKVAGCRALARQAPRVTDYLCSGCRDHFAAVQQGLRDLGHPFVVEPAMVRGLDYYTRTVFEVSSPQLGAQAQVCGGGRYDNLVEQCGGPPTPAVGFACGIERLALLLQAGGAEVPTPPGPIFVAYVGLEQQPLAFRLCSRLRRQGLAAEMDWTGRSLKAQMKAADRLRSRWALILGEAEVREDLVTVRDMSSGEQSSQPLEDAIALVRR